MEKKIPVFMINLVLFLFVAKTLIYEVKIKYLTLFLMFCFHIFIFL